VVGVVADVSTARSMEVNASACAERTSLVADVRPEFHMENN